jgi:hypothetical protein
VIPRAPEMKRFHRKKSKQGTLTDKEIAMLFPECPGALDCIWRQSDAREGRYGGLMFGALFALILSTGMRSGEGRAVRREQIDRKRFGLIIDQSVDSKNRIVGHLKKGGEDDPRLRVAIIPARAMKILDWWLKVAPPIPTDLIFSYRGETITKEHLGARFALGLDRAGIDKEGRKLTPHALRYTYNTRMARLIPGEPLRLMIFAAEYSLSAEPRDRFAVSSGDHLGYDQASFSKLAFLLRKIDSVQILFHFLIRILRIPIALVTEYSQAGHGHNVCRQSLLVLQARRRKGIFSYPRTLLL